MIESYILFIFSTWAWMAIVMLALWILYLLSNEGAIADVGWSLAIGLGSIWMFSWSQGGGYWGSFVLLLILTWSGRLTLLLALRLWRGQRDRRYDDLAKWWERGRLGKTFLYFQGQSLIGAILLTPLALFFYSPPPFSLIGGIGFVLFCIALVGESLADKQMSRFRSDSNNRGRVCEVGLWRYSRHPNYFFEWLVWVALAIIGMSGPYGYWGVLSPAIMLFFLLKVTGIPPTERKLVESKGDLYRDYQRRTSSFVPLPRSWLGRSLTK